MAKPNPLKLLEDIRSVTRQLSRIEVKRNKTKVREQMEEQGQKLAAMGEELGKLDHQKHLDQIQELVLKLKGMADELPESKRKDLSRQLSSLGQGLKDLGDTIDDIAQPDFVFDPSDPLRVGILISETLLKQRKKLLSALENERFYGSGVYAIYYSGKFDAYAPISDKNHPIYIGKVDPADPTANTPREQKDKLWQRLVKDHLKSISAARTTLNPEDFSCRYLVVKSAWQNTAENYLITMFKPIWNNEMKICYGFGKHGDNAETRQNRRSPWDTLHPGRKWAKDEKNVKGKFTVREIKKSIAEHFAKVL